MANHRWNRMRPWLLAAAATLVGLALMAACAVAHSSNPLSSSASQARLTELAEGDPVRGWQALQAYGCNTCHTIPGVPGADALVGPPLDDWAGRGYIAGSLTNTPANLVMWIQSPQEIEPGTAMPDMAVSETDAWNMAAYLFTLQPDRPWWQRWTGAGVEGG